MTKQQLTKARTKLGLTKTELGQALGFTYKHINQLENGKTPIHLTKELAVRWLLFKARCTYTFR